MVVFVGHVLRWFVRGVGKADDCDNTGEMGRNNSQEQRYGTCHSRQAAYNWWGAPSQWWSGSCHWNSCCPHSSSGMQVFLIGYASPHKTPLTIQLACGVYSCCHSELYKLLVLSFSVWGILLTKLPVQCIYRFHDSWQVQHYHFGSVVPMCLAIICSTVFAWSIGSWWSCSTLFLVIYFSISAGGINPKHDSHSWSFGNTSKLSRGGYQVLWLCVGVQWCEKRLVQGWVSLSSSFWSCFVPMPRLPIS